MPRIDLTNDEYHGILTARNEASLVNGYCEDYPCCGHTAEDPCRRQWYDHPDAFNPRVNPHALCEHEYGICEVEPDEVDPEDCQHSSVHRYARMSWGAWYECSYCDTMMEPVTDIDQHFFESSVVPGMWLDIPVLVINYRVKP